MKNAYFLASILLSSVVLAATTRFDEINEATPMYTASQADATFATVAAVGNLATSVNAVDTWLSTKTNSLGGVKYADNAKAANALDNETGDTRSADDIFDALDAAATKTELNDALDDKVSKTGDSTIMGGLTVSNLTVGSRLEGSTVGKNSVAEGERTTASGSGSHAEGYNTRASGIFSHAEGSNTTASGTYSHAEGGGTTASNNFSHAEGWFTTAGGQGSHAKGISTTASGNYSHAEGHFATASGQAAHAEGNYTTASGDYSHAEGEGSIASNEFSHAEGEGSIASGKAAHAEGYQATASGDYSHAEGGGTTTSNNFSHAEGMRTTAIGYASHSEGYYTTASNNYSHAEGEGSIASGQAAHAEGNYTTASGIYSHAEGRNTRAVGDYSHAEGFGTRARGNYSHTDGWFTVSTNETAYVWQGTAGNYTEPEYYSHGNGTYNINPAGDAAGFYIGETNLETRLATATTNLNARPISILPGQTLVDLHGDTHNGPVEIGEGATAIADTSEVSTNTPIRSVSIAIGAGADARDLDHPDKQQSIAIGNQSRASGVNSLAIGSGVRHVDEDDMTGGNAYALGAQAIALGYSAKSVTNNAVQIGTGVNSEPHTLQFEDTVIVRGGKVVTDGLDTNAVRRMIQDESEKGIMYGSTGSTNGYAFIRMQGYNGAQDTDPEFVLAINTNENADVAASFPIYPGSPNRREVYSAATVDRLLAKQAWYDSNLDTVILQGARSNAPTNFGQVAVAIGYDSWAGGDDGAIAIGASSRARQDFAIAIGADSVAAEPNSVVIGPSAHSHGTNTVTIGWNSFRPENLYIGDSNLVEIVNALIDARIAERLGLSVVNGELNVSYEEN